MALLETAKRMLEAVSGLAWPSADELPGLLQPRKADRFRFKDDGIVPNHPRWPLLVYRGAVRLPAHFDPAAVFEVLFEHHGWGRSWRDGIYDYPHYHSQVHEALGVARGSGKVRFGGAGGRTLPLKAGDVAILPAGTGHQRLAASDDLLVVGAYPPFGAYDECSPESDHAEAVAAIAKVRRPREDPVYGAKGLLVDAWAG